MYGYKCDMCGCYLDPNEGRTCDECQERAEKRYQKMKRISGSVRINEENQYELRLEVV